MANSDGQVRIYIDTNAKEAAQALNESEKAFKKNADTVKSVSSVYNAYQQGIQQNIQALREMALGGGKNSAEFQRLAQQTRDYKKALADANNSVDEAVGGMDKQQNGMNKLVSAGKQLIAAYVSIQGAIKAFHFALESVEIYRVQERAIIGLTTALKNAGVYTGEYANHLQKLASEIQNYSNYADEAILKAQGVAQAFVGSIPITDELTKAVIDFAAAMDMDLEQAFTLVGKSIGSSTNALGRYGVELQKGMTDSQKMAAITKQLGDRYRGQAAQMANASTQLKNSIGDLKEAIGRGLNPVLEASQRKMIAWAKAATAAINKMAVLRAEVKSLGLDELNERLKANIDRVAEIDSHYNPKANWQIIAANEERRNKLLEDRKQILEQIKKLQAPAQAKPIKFKEDDFSGSVPVTTAPSSTASANIKKIKDDYERLQESVAKAKREIEVAAVAHGTSSKEVQHAFTSYRQLNQQLQEIGNLFEPEKVKIEEQKGAYQQLQDKIIGLTQSLRDLAAENKIGTTEWANQKTALTEAQAELDKINKSLKDNGVNVQELSKSISSNLSSGLVTALRTGGKAFDAFSNLAVLALQKVLDKLLEMTVITPLLNAFTGGIGGSIFGGIGKLFGSADGNVFKNGNVIPFARGGIVKQPTVFPMANGGTGLMGEAGAEAVMPLRRMSNGRLGVEADTQNNGTVVNIYNQSQSQIETHKRDNGSMDIIIKRVNEALMNERTSSGFRAAYQREDRKGLQAV